MVAKGLRVAARFVAFGVFGVLAGAVLAVVLVGPSVLVDAAVGVPVSLALLALGGYAFRRYVLHRRGPAIRRSSSRKLAAWYRREQRLAYTLELRQRHPAQSRLEAYREAAPLPGVFGYFGGLLVGAYLIRFSPVGAASLIVVMLVLVSIPLVGFVLAVLYEVHGHDQVLAWRHRRLAARLARRGVVAGIGQVPLIEDFGQDADGSAPDDDAGE